jgi:hypothetical protein
MAGKNHSGGPGTSTNRGVTSTMSNANNVKTSTGSNGMGAPFDKPHSMGNGGIPLTMYDKSIKTPAVPAPMAGQNTVPTLGGQGGQKRSGSK